METKIIKTVSCTLALMLFNAVPNLTRDVHGSWSDGYISFCVSRGIISGDENGDMMPDYNLTREQMAKMILKAFSVNTSNLGTPEYADVSVDRWSYDYIAKYSEYEIEHQKFFKPEESVSREEFMAMTVKIAGYGNVTPMHEHVFRSKFYDCDEVDSKYYKLLDIGFEKGFIKGSNGLLRPKDKLTRAEACSMFYTVIYAIGNNRLSDIYYEEQSRPQITVPTTKAEIQETMTGSTSLIGASEVTLEQAKKWAANRGAHQRYIDIADLYWKYGELTGLRADILYAQAAKETNFGKYTGQVKPEQNNWAGIKKYGATGDLPEDHEDFATPEDGVRGHFNHMCAYVGLNPIGVTHGRYKSVKSLSWAGTVKTVEQLGGKWCPNLDYGYSILRDYVEPMKATRIN